MGYSSIELGLWGVPTYFYNSIGTSSVQTILDLTGGAVHSYQKECELAEASLALLRTPKELRQVGHRLRQYVESYNDSKHVVGQIETFYERVVASTQKS
jgi:hypothetical protein